MLFNIEFLSNTILSCFFFIFLIIDQYFLTLATIAQIFNYIAEFVITTGKPNKEAKAEFEIHPVTAEAIMGKRSI